VACTYYGSRLEATSLFIPGDLVTHGHPIASNPLEVAHSLRFAATGSPNIIYSNNGSTSVPAAPKRIIREMPPQMKVKDFVIGMATKLIEEKRNVLYPLKAITRPRVNAFFLDLTDVPHQALSSNLSPKVLVTASLELFSINKG